MQSVQRLWGGYRECTEIAYRGIQSAQRGAESVQWGMEGVQRGEGRLLLTIIDLVSDDREFRC